MIGSSRSAVVWLSLSLGACTGLDTIGLGSDLPIDAGAAGEGLDASAGPDASSGELEDANADAMLGARDAADGADASDAAAVGADDGATRDADSAGDGDAGRDAGDDDHDDDDEHESEH